MAMKAASLEPLLVDILVVFGVVALSLAVYAVVIQPWLAVVEVLQ